MKNKPTPVFIPEAGGDTLTFTQQAAATIEEVRQRLIKFIEEKMKDRQEFVFEEEICLISGQEKMVKLYNHKGNVVLYTKSKLGAQEYEYHLVDDCTLTIQDLLWITWIAEQLEDEPKS